MTSLRRARAGCLLVVLLGVLAGCGAGGGTPTAAPATANGPSAGAQALPGPQPIPSAAVVTPVRLVAATIGVDESALVPLDRDPGTGELDAPVDFHRAGYYRDGPAPGDPGPAVVAAHVDDRAGPAVFLRLRELAVGDPVEVTRSDGTVVEFRVDAVEQYPKDAFPTQAVYGPQPGPSLRLITCGGTFDAAARSYRDNVVVYASTVVGPRGT